ncbi:MAG: 3-isopropylmalate dehydrogenase, partial [Clostridia bacterium]|nr:3-isopropylmalate dehydrogenase [Clostridia bacterium]
MYKIAVLPGDGIGPEVVREALKVLTVVEQLFDLTFEIEILPFGGHGIDVCSSALPEATKDACLKSHAVLLGAVGGPKWDHLAGDLRPERGLLELRKALGTYANLRPAKLIKPLASSSPLRLDLVCDGFDIMVVRELTGGIYFGAKGRDLSEEGHERAYDIEAYNKVEIERIAKKAFEIARKRSRRVASVDKANVLESSRLWREVVKAVSENYPDVVLEHMYVDNAAMQLIQNPSQFDVLLTNNIFGDILSDEASMLTGSIGLLPSASIGDSGPGLYEPIHGSAPDLAGRDIANPIATILSLAMMLDYSFNLHEPSKRIYEAVESVLNDGHRTQDLKCNQTKEVVSTSRMGDLIIDSMQNQKGA